MQRISYPNTIEQATHNAHRIRSEAAHLALNNGFKGASRLFNKYNPQKLFRR